jgi:hypothetical protein
MPLPPRLLAAVAFVAATASLASAEPLDLGRVSAKAIWLMHADMDAARESTVMRRMVERAMQKYPQFEGMLSMAATMTGMDLRKDLHDVTVYGLDTDKKNGVMIVHADANRKFLEKMVEKARDHETMKHRGYTLHKWTHKGWKGRGSETVAGAFFKDDSPLAGRTRPGSILVGRASKVDPDTKCPVLKQGEGFRVAMGESDGKSFYRARLDMVSADAADLAEDVAEGLAATLALGLGKEPGVMKLVEGIETTTAGTTCMIAWDADADDVWEVAEAMVEKIEAKMAARRKQWGGRKSGCGDCGQDGCEKGTCPMEKERGADQERDDEDRRPFRDDEF